MQFEFKNAEKKRKLWSISGCLEAGMGCRGVALLQSLRKLLEIMDMGPDLIVVMVFRMYAFVKLTNHTF